MCLLSRALDIAEAGEESGRGARRTIRRVLVLRDCSFLCIRNDPFVQGLSSGLIQLQTMVAHGRVARM